MKAVTVLRRNFIGGHKKVAVVKVIWNRCAEKSKLNVQRRCNDLLSSNAKFQGPIDVRSGFTLRVCFVRSCDVSSLLHKCTQFEIILLSLSSYRVCSIVWIWGFFCCKRFQTKIHCTHRLTNFFTSRLGDFFPQSNCTSLLFEHLMCFVYSK